METEPRLGLLGHRQTKGAATDIPSLPPPRHISTLPTPGFGRNRPADKSDRSFGARDGRIPLIRFRRTCGSTPSRRLAPARRKGASSPASSYGCLRASSNRSKGARSPSSDAAASASSTRWLRGITLGLTLRIALARSMPAVAEPCSALSSSLAQRARQRASHASGARASANSARSGASSPAAASASRRHPSVKSTRSA